MIYLLLFIAGYSEEFCSIIYYKLVQKHYKFLCSIVSIIRTFIWAFVVSNLVTHLNNFVPYIAVYAIGGAIGDYTSLTVEPYLDKHIIKIQRKGRKNKWWFIFGDRKK